MMMMTMIILPRTHTAERFLQSSNSVSRRDAGFLDFLFSLPNFYQRDAMPYSAVFVSKVKYTSICIAHRRNYL